MNKIKEYLNSLGEEDESLADVTTLISNSLNESSFDINSIDSWIEKELKKIESQTQPDVQNQVH